MSEVYKYGDIELPLPIRVEHWEQQAFFDAVKATPLRGQPTKRPYASAEMHIQYGDFKQWQPCQLYALRPALDRIIALRFMLIDQFDIDLLTLKSAVRMVYVDKDADGKTNTTYRDLLPPVIETDVTRSLTHLICDGLHRCLLGVNTVREGNVLHITAVHPQMPYYAYPNVNGWDDVAMIDGGPNDSVPESVRKKFYRTSNHKAAYRDFNATFAAVTGSRPVHKVGAG